MIGSELEIRIMTIDDYPKVFLLWQTTAGIGMRSLDDSREGIAKFLDRNPGFCFVAETGREIAGVILSGHDGRRGYIYHASVREMDRGKGIGAALVDKAENAMKRQGINKIALVAHANNARGNKFWEKQAYITRPDLVYRNKSLNDENE